MNRLRIEGIIAAADDKAATANGKDKIFTPQDLYNFLDSNGGGDFDVVIASPGGNVDAGFEIYRALKPLGVTTIAEKANSIASIIFLAGKKRKIFKDSELIIHNAWISSDQLNGAPLNIHSIQAMSAFFQEQDLKILEVYASVAGNGKASELTALMAQETNLGSERAKALGFATEIIYEEAPVFNFQNRVVTFSGAGPDNLTDGPKTIYSDVVLVNPDGKFLLLQRKNTDSFEPGKWGLPGGKVMPGETTAEGAARELVEETGLNAELQPVAEISNDDDSCTFYFCGLAEADPGETPEHAAWEWAESLEGFEIIKDNTERFKSLINQSLNKLGMDNTKEKLGAFEKMLTGLMRAFKSSAKNMTVTTSEGVELFIQDAESDGELVGKTAFVAEEGLPSEIPAPEGPHTLSDGTVIVVGEGGVIAEAEAPVDPENLKAAYEEEKEKMAAQITALEEEKTELENKVKALTDKNKTNEKTAAEIKKSFEALRAEVLGDPEKKTEATPKQLPDDEWAKLAPSEKIRLRAMNKAG